MADTKTSRVAEVKVVSITENVVAKQGAYKGGILDVVNVTELSNNVGLNINLRRSEKKKSERWKAAAKTGNVLRVHLSRINGGKEFVDRDMTFEVIDIKDVNLPKPVRPQEPMKAFTDPSQSLELANGLQYEKITRAQEKIREAMLTIKHAQEEIDDAFKAIKEDSIS